jgi:hypothetical protein
LSNLPVRGVRYEKISGTKLCTTKGHTAPRWCNRPHTPAIGLTYCTTRCVRRVCVVAQVNNLREIQALRRLSPHPNIIKLLEVL